uniref:Uncharacterized protein n=1 Tax=Caenorhabditis japonica TaxID=281687 RepID=A0A8R1ES54_CAEJA
MSSSDSSTSSSELFLKVDDLKNRLLNLDAFVHGHLDFRHKIVRSVRENVHSSFESKRANLFAPRALLEPCATTESVRAQRVTYPLRIQFAGPMGEKYENQCQLNTISCRDQREIHVLPLISQCDQKDGQSEGKMQKRTYKNVI